MHRGPATAARAQVAQHLDAAHPRHRHVEEDDLGRGGVDETEGLDAARGLLAGHHRAVHLAEADQPHSLAGVRGGDLEAQARLLLPHLAQHRHQERAPEVVADRHPQGRGRPPGELAEVGEEGLGLGAELQDAGQRGLARRGEAHSAAGALQQAHAQVPLQLADLLADRGGGAVLQARRRAHRAAARDGEQAQQGRQEAGVDH